MSKKTTTTTTTKPTADALADFLTGLHFSSKKRGGRNGDGLTATFCRTAKTPRLYMPAGYGRDGGYLSGMVARDADGNFTAILSKKPYSGLFYSIHDDQRFFTVSAANADALRDAGYHFTVGDPVVIDDDRVAVALTPAD